MKPHQQFKAECSEEIKKLGKNKCLAELPIKMIFL